jgi:hypothetical protein
VARLSKGGGDARGAKARQGPGRDSARKVKAEVRLGKASQGPSPGEAKQGKGRGEAMQRKGRG